MKNPSKDSETRGQDLKPELPEYANHNIWLQFEILVLNGIGVSFTFQPHLNPSNCMLGRHLSHLLIPPMV
jgi:hypothetical protein